MIAGIQNSAFRVVTSEGQTIAAGCCGSQPACPASCVLCPVLCPVTSPVSCAPRDAYNCVVLQGQNPQQMMISKEHRCTTGMRKSDRDSCNINSNSRQ